MSNLEGKYGRFINPDEGEGWNVNHVDTRGKLFPQSIYEFSLIYPAPLTWYDNRLKAYFRPDKNFTTNLGSTPFFTRPVMPQSQFPRSYCFHDSTWLHLGIFRAEEYAGDYEYVPMNRWEANRMLFRQVDAEGGRWRKHLILPAVDLGALWGGIWG